MVTGIDCITSLWIEVFKENSNVILHILVFKDMGFANEGGVYSWVEDKKYSNYS